MKECITIVLSVIGACLAYAAGSFLCESYLTKETASFKEGLKKYWIMALIYAVIALIGGFLFAKYNYPPTQIIGRFLVLYTVIAVAEIDRREYIIPNKAVLFLFASKVFLLFADFFCRREEWVSLLMSSLLGLLIGGVTFLIGYVISRHGLGLGDVKLLAAIGFSLGDSTAVMIILVSLLFSAVYGIVQIVRKKLKAKDEMPFGPFVAVASVLLLILGF